MIFDLQLVCALNSFLGDPQLRIHGVFVKVFRSHRRRIVSLAAHRTGSVGSGDSSHFTAYFKGTACFRM